MSADARPAPATPAPWLGAVDLSVVVPAYNEEDRIGPSLEALRAYLDAHVGTRAGAWELIVADDGSTDRTAELVAAAAAAEPRIRLVSAERNKGKGDALRRGVLASGGRRVLLTDADLATPIEELGHLEKALTEPHVAAAIGSRAHPDSRIEHHQSRLRELLGRAGNRLIRAVAVPGIRDTQCGFKLLDGDRARAAFAASRLDGWGIDVEILQYFRRQGWPVAEVPVRWSHQEGSKVRPGDYLKVLGELARLKAGALAVAGLYLLGSLLLYKGLWADLGTSYLADAGQDQNQWEWFFAVTADNVSHLRNPLFSDLQGMPDGVNLMANTVMLGLSVPLTPVNLALGPAVTWALVLTLGLAGTALAWFWLIRRWLVGSRWPAALGGALAAFAPPMVSHANAHPNFCVLFMIPLIVDRALRLCAPGHARRPVRDGVLLGLFSAYQVFLGEEPFLLAAVGMLLFAVSYAVVAPAAARAAVRPLAKGLGIAALVAVPIVAFPLWWQFFGPQSYHSVLHGDAAGNSPRAFVEYAQRSLFGDEAQADKLALNRTEQNAFYGWPLLALCAGIAFRQWRRPAVKALTATAAVAAWLSLGQRIGIPGTDLVVPGPWRLLAHQPLFESVIEGRVGMVCAAPLAMLVAVGADRIRTFPVPRERTLALLVVAAALLPIVPTPFPVRDRAPVPQFIADGTWRRYLPADRTLVPIPVPDPGAADALHWQVEAGLGFKMPGGYFNGPWGPERTGIYGATPRWTSNLLSDVRGGKEPPTIGKEWRDQARRDLRWWEAGLLVLPQDQERAQVLRDTVTKLVGRPPERVTDVWIWRGPFR
ncbi:dolichyl-phosphate beta-glucosyltransferase [Streptomyces sp. NRRL S-87]|uniref:dolichyl-phosphate beta-glucosyltransferase n=1 Tax=Streptomyces sp. NRRL S-87 TaxID=1463920 RepID=UPI0004C120A8|nr:dolichyl-phosphate beta-glucosyltransferase [Streptomyces sp. NRRL S-87]